MVPPFELPLVNTLTLLLSGTTVTWAHHALQTGDRNGAKIGLVLTILLGMLFTSIQAFEYHHILTDQLFYRPGCGRLGPLRLGLLHGHRLPRLPRHHRHHLPDRLPDPAAGRRLHADSKHFGFEAAAWYWHFVDVVWLFLFTFLYFTFGAGWGK